MSRWRKEVLGVESAGEKFVIKHIIKRDGQLEMYSREKLFSAIMNAASAIDNSDVDLVNRLTDNTEVKIKQLMLKRHQNSAPAIEEIQDMIEEVLIEDRQVAIAKAFILYRAKHQSIRDTKELFLDINETMEGYLAQTDWRVNENANVNYSLGGLILHNSGTITANYWLNNIYPKEIGEAHINADYHIHDLSMFSGYCAGWSVLKVKSVLNHPNICIHLYFKC